MCGRRDDRLQLMRNPLGSHEEQQPQQGIRGVVCGKAPMLGATVPRSKKRSTPDQRSPTAARHAGRHKHLWFGFRSTSIAPGRRGRTAPRGGHAARQVPRVFRCGRGGVLSPRGQHGGWQYPPAPPRARGVAQPEELGSGGHVQGASCRAACLTRKCSRQTQTGRSADEPQRSLRRQGTVSSLKSFAADLHSVRRQGIGISRSRQILRARNSLISRWRGTLADFRVRGLM